MKKRNKSILQSDLTECLICKTTQNIEIHEVFFGNNRKNSIEHGLYVGLCHNHHRGKEGVHFNKFLNDKLRKFAQRKFEEQHSHEKFMRIFGKNYL